MKIREFDFDLDYGPAAELWKDMDIGVQFGRSDTPEEILKKVKRDPDLFLVAEEDQKLIGTVIGGYDGRRGMVYHLAVNQINRGQGVGSALLAEVEKRLVLKGCRKCYLLVTSDNEHAIHFYEKKEWVEMKSDLIFAKEFE